MIASPFSCAGLGRACKTRKLATDRRAAGKRQPLPAKRKEGWEWFMQRKEGNQEL